MTGIRPPVSRRTFLERLALLGALPLVGRVAEALAAPPSGRSAGTPEARAPGPGTMKPARALGKTGHSVALFSLGGQATIEGQGKRKEAVAIINRAIDLGVNYVDTAPAYGPSQDYIGEVMATRRAEVFLASKTHDRSRDGSLRLLDDSLSRLRTDHLDLWQLHNLTDTGDLDRIFASNGAIHAMEAARADGRVRFLGLTGHFDPKVLVDGIHRFPFDTVLCALNPADRHRKSFIEKLLPVATERGMGIIGMKVPSRGRIFREGGIETMRQAMGYVLTLPVSTVIIGCSTLAEVEENASIARDWEPFSTTEMAHLEDLTRPYHKDVSFYKAWG